VRDFFGAWASPPAVPRTPDLSRQAGEAIGVTPQNGYALGIYRKVQPIHR